MMKLVLCVFHFIVVSHALTTPSPESILACRSLSALQPLTRTILLVSPEKFSPKIKYLQKATNTRIEGQSELLQACESFDSNFQSEMGVESTVTRVSTVAPQMLLINWNVTWVPISAVWLETLGQAWPGIEVVPISYNHLSNRMITFSWKAVGKLFSDAIATGKLRIPLACIEGTSELVFSNDGMLLSISEDLSYAQDLARGSLQNRKCADDLRLFLETGRRISSNNNWDDIVAQALPWSSVPGSNPLDVTPMEEGEEGGPVIFLGIAAVLLLGFANAVGPLLIGQSLFGPTNYIVQPQDLNSIF